MKTCKYYNKCTGLSNCFKCDKFTTLQNEAIKSLVRKGRLMEWIPFEKKYDEEMEGYILSGSLPNDEQDVLVTDGKRVWNDTFYNDGECYLDSGYDLFDEVTAWMPFPEPYNQ